MIRFLIHRPKWIVAVVGVLVFWLAQNEWLTTSSLWQKAEGALIDRRYHNRPYLTPHPEIKLVGIQNSTISLDELAPEEIAASPALKLMQHPWPWTDRKVYADVLEKLMGAGAKVVVFDFVFASQTEGDDVFAQACWKNTRTASLPARNFHRKNLTERFLKNTRRPIRDFAAWHGRHCRAGEHLGRPG